VTRLHHYDNLNTARFVTVSCFHRYRLFSNDSVIEVFLEELNLVRRKYSLRILGYVVMPEHAHLVIWPPQGVLLGRVIGELKSCSARRMLEQIVRGTQLRTDRLHIIRDGESRTVFWQRRCYDHNCRTPEIVKEKINYCHNNPVRRGLVGTPGEWKWSSFNWYQGKSKVPLEIDEWE
jgi:putative transposase